MYFVYLYDNDTQGESFLVAQTTFDDWENFIEYMRIALDKELQVTVKEG